MLFRRTAVAIPLATPALAQQRFPNRAVRLVVPWLPGGSAEHLRVLAELSGRHLGQPVIIENRPGASGTLGPALIAQEPRGDGHLIGQMPVTIFRIPAMSRRLTFDPMADFSWIIHLTGHVFGVVVRSDSRYRSWEEFLDYAKANPGRVSNGSPGVGTSLHITMERIAAERGIEFLHVPFRGGADTTQALLNGSVECAANSTGWAPMVQEGRFRLLVVWSAERGARQALPQSAHPARSGWDRWAVRGECSRQRGSALWHGRDVSRPLAGWCRAGGRYSRGLKGDQLALSTRTVQFWFTP